MRARLPRIGYRHYASAAKTSLIFPIKPPPAPPAPPPPPQSSSPPSSSSSKGQSSSSTGSTTLLPKPRLDYNHLLLSPPKTTLNHLQRRSPLSPDHVSHLSRLRSTQLILLQKISSIKNKQKEVGLLIHNGLGDSDEYIRQAKKLKTRIVEYERTLGEVDSELLELGLALPNFSHPDVPLGGEEEAITLETFGPNPITADTKRDHLDIANHYGLLDNEASAIASGNSWPYLKGELALLELALTNYAMGIAIKHGFKPVITPDVVKVDLATRCGFQPRDPNGSTQTYFISPDSESTSSSSASGSGSSEATPPTHCLAGTAEIPLSALFANKIIPHASLPQKVVGLGRAFRAEAGARGTDTRGLYRVHQFSKVELFAVTDVEGSWDVMEEMRGVQKEIAEGLGLSVRVLDMPTEELGASAARKYDMEAWMPGRGKWGEITSTSNCTDYQSRRLHIRYRPSPSPSSSISPGPGPSPSPTSPSNTNTTKDPLPFAHTLNGTAAAIPRLLVALLENGARFGDGSSASVVGEGERGEEGKVAIGVRVGGGGIEEAELLGVDLPVALKKYWIGGESIGEKKKGVIRWV